MRDPPDTTGPPGQSPPCRSPASGTLRALSGWLRRLQALGPGQLAQPPQRLDLQLADPLPGEREPRRDLGERVLPPVLQAVPRPHDAGGPVVQVAEKALDPLPLQGGEDDVLGR